MERGLLFGSVSMMALVLAADPLAADKTTSEEAFDRLATLKGEWRGEQEGVKINLIYTLTANGSALMEEFRPESGAVMITMFTVDGDHLIATHYCSAKNQPQHHGIEITRRLAQYRPYRDPGRQRSFDSRVDLPVQGEEREKNLPIYASTAMSKLTTRRE